MARPRSDIQPRIVEAARARFLAEGVDGASLREIARDAGTNIGMIVYYFPTKDDLFLAVVEEVYGGIVEDMRKILGVDGSARERLRGAFVRLGHASPLELEVIQLVVREALSSSTRLRRLFARFMRGHLALLTATIADGLKNGEFDSAIPAPLILVAVMGLGGIPQIARRASRSIPLVSGLPRTEVLADLSIAMLFRAAGAPGDVTAAAPSKASRARRPAARRP
jgi:AcrR family transcriptional regulator